MSVQFLQNTYAGEVLDDLLAYTVQGNDTYRQGLIYVKSGIQFKYVIPRIELDEIIQDNIPTPVSPTDSKGQYSFTERYLEPQDFMVYLEFNPRDFEVYWKQWQPEGNLVFRELDPALQAKMLRQLMEKKNEHIGTAIWQSTKGGGAGGITPPAGAPQMGTGTFKYYDGVMKRLIDNINAAVPGDTAIVAGTAPMTTGADVESALYAMWHSTPARLRNRDITYVMDWELWDLYDKYLTSQGFKYTDNTQINTYKFKGKRVIPIVGVPPQTIVLGNFTTGRDSNLWMGVDYANDENVVRIDQLQNNSELYFFQMRMKMDVNIVLPGDIIVWTAYS